jgi:hypothetical protein
MTPPAASYRPPKHVLEVLQKIEYEEALAPGDPRYVDTQRARGSEQTFTRLARKLGWDPVSEDFFPTTEKHVLFFGPVGSGKTTELRRFADELNRSTCFYVVEVNLLAKLDKNNIQYSEALMAMAEALLEQLNRDGYNLGEAALAPVRSWFASAVTTDSNSSELNAELKAGMRAGGGVPGLIKLFAGFTAAFKTGSTHKTEWRQQIRNRFTSLAAAFNDLIRAAEHDLRKNGRAARVVFLLDGTDKMRGEDTQQFFVYDAEQLLAIQTLAIYTAPLHMKYDGRLGGKLDADLVLPMIKLNERDGTPCVAGRTALRDLLLRRADRALFASDAEIDRLVEACGGHPRELLRLLKLCCELGDSNIDADVVTRAIAQLAADYRRFLTPEDYALLREIDERCVHAGNDDRAQQLLHRLALMEYNDGSWRCSLPVVRTLEGYQQAGAAPPPAAG